MSGQPNYYRTTDAAGRQILQPLQGNPLYLDGDPCTGRTGPVRLMVAMAYQSSVLHQSEAGPILEEAWQYYRRGTALASLCPSPDKMGIHDAFRVARDATHVWEALDYVHAYGEIGIADQELADRWPLVVSLLAMSEFRYVFPTEDNPPRDAERTLDNALDALMQLPNFPTPEYHLNMITALRGITAARVSIAEETGNYAGLTDFLADARDALRMLPAMPDSPENRTAYAGLLAKLCVYQVTALHYSPENIAYAGDISEQLISDLHLIGELHPHLFHRISGPLESARLLGQDMASIAASGAACEKPSPGFDAFTGLIEQRIAQLADQEEFEEAAKIRDRLKELRGE
ncbi:MAG: UvrB/UvrC motif-containing protein [archaeon]